MIQGASSEPKPWMRSWVGGRSGFEPSAHYDEPAGTIGDAMPNAASNVDNQSLRSFLDMVATGHPDELLRIAQPVDTRFDMTAIVYELERAGKSPVISSARPHPAANGSSANGMPANGMPVVTNVAGNRSCSRHASASLSTTCRPPSASGRRNTFLASS